MRDFKLIEPAIRAYGSCREVARDEDFWDRSYFSLASPSVAYKSTDEAPSGLIIFLFNY